MSDARRFITVGVDGGATKVTAIAVEPAGDGLFAPASESITLLYSESTDFNPGFRPVDLRTQLHQYQNSRIVLENSEMIQGKAIIEIIGNCIEQIQREKANRALLVGLGFPGIKTGTGEGIAVLANGPRIPDFTQMLEMALRKRRIILEDRPGKIGSDADYCGIGENYCVGGNFIRYDNAYYIGGGTGVADALKLNGNLVSFDSARNWMAKTWEFKAENDLSLERYISADGIQALYGHESGISVDRLISDGIYHDGILRMAEDGNRHAVKTCEQVIQHLAFLIHERISTLYSGSKHEIEFINPDRKKLETSHPYTGTVLDKIVIGQRLSEFFRMARESGTWYRRFLNMLGRQLVKDKTLDDRLKNHYLENNSFRFSLILLSTLREAPAIGAAVDRYLLFTGRDT